MIVDLLFVLAVVALLIAIYKIKFSDQSVADQIEKAHKQLQQEKNRLKQKSTGNQPEVLAQNQAWQEDSNSESDNQNDKEEDGPINRRKQLKKQLKMKEKQQRKQAHEQFLNQEKQKRQKYDEEQEEKQKVEEEKRLKEEQVLQQLREDERIRKEAEFNKWKNMFNVQETGKQKLSQDEEEKKIEYFNKTLIAMLIKNKLSLLEDLSHKFKVPTKEIIDKIKAFEVENLISGIFDERGKYLVIEESQWDAVRNYISAKGRVKKTDIMKQCARLIKIPENTDNQLLSLIQDEEHK